MYEINKQVAYESLMEEIVELVGSCGGWDEKTETFKPSVNEQIRMISLHARQAIGLPITDEYLRWRRQQLYGERQWTMERIAEALNVSTRQISKD